jgi:hypothetical protein
MWDDQWKLIQLLAINYRFDIKNLKINKASIRQIGLFHQLGEKISSTLTQWREMYWRRKG